MLGIREFKNFYDNLEVGKSFYLNAIGAKKNVIDYVQMLIQAGKITPIKEEVEKQIIFPDKIYSGEMIVSQMTYKKIKE